MHEQMIALLERHCHTIRQEAVDINECIESFCSSPDNADVGRACFLVHKIKGSSGSLGFLPISQAAEALEDVLKDKATPLDTTNIRALNSVMQAEISEMAPQNSNLYNKFSGVSA